MSITCPCRTNKSSATKQLNGIVRHLSKHLRNSQKIISKVLEDIPKLLEILSESFEEDSGLFCNEHLRSLEVERSSRDHCTVPYCVVCAFKERGVNKRKENTARHLSDVLQGARENEVNEFRTETSACSKHKRRDTSKKDLEITNTTFSSFQNKKSEYFGNVNLLKGSNHNLQEGLENQSLTTSKSHARKCGSIESESGHKTNLNVQNNTLEEADSKLHSTVPTRECHKAHSQTDDKQIVENSILDNLPQLSAIERFSSVLRGIMEGIENCSELATTLASDTPVNLPANPTEMPKELSLQDQTMATNNSSFSLGENYLENSSKVMEPVKENSVKIFDFGAEEAKKVSELPEGKDFVEEMKPKEKEKHQIDIEAEFSDELGESNFERGFKSPAKEFIKLQPPTDTPGNNGGSHRESCNSTTTEPNGAKESKLNKQNSVRRNKSVKTDRGFKFFKRKIFSKSMKNSSKSKNVGKGATSSWESFDVVRPSIEVVPKEDDEMKGICDCDTLNRITELEDTIKQMEKKKNSLEEEKLDLMNALSNMWIEMEDLKNKDQGNNAEEDNTNIAALQKIDHGEDISDVSKNKTSSSFKGMSKSQESFDDTQEELNKEDLDNEIKTLNRTKSLQSETLQSLKIKLSGVNEDKESLSRKLNEMFDKNKALEEKLQKVSGKTNPELDKVLEENHSLRSRLDSLSGDKLLLEKNNKKLKIEKKKHKLMKLQIQKGCENLIHKINETLQNETTLADKVEEAPGKLRKNPAQNKTSAEKCSPSSEDSLNVAKDANSVIQIVRKLERTKSIDSEVRAREKVMKKAGTRDGRSDGAPATVKRAETLKTSNSELTDGRRKEMKVTRFPPAQPSKGDKVWRELFKSSSGNETGFRFPVSSDSQGPSMKSVKENQADPCWKFFEHLQAKCLVLVERFTVLNGKVERVERNGEVYGSSPQGMETSTQSSSPTDEPASFDKVLNQNNQKDTVLLSCLRNLQKENDNLKLDNLKYKALVVNMQDKCNEDVSEKIEDEITAEKNSIRRAEKELHDLELRVVPERDVGLLESMPESNNQLLEVEGEEDREDMSSWHRKYSKKSREAKESAKALAKNEREVMKISQAIGVMEEDTSLKNQGNAFPGKTDNINTDRQASDKAMVRAVSFDEGKALGPRLIQEPTEHQNNTKSKSLENGLQRQEGDVIVAPDNVSNDGAALNMEQTCCKSFSVNGHHHQHCSLILERMRAMSFDESTITPTKPRENNKTLKKAMSTYGHRDRQYQVHYV